MKLRIRDMLLMIADMFLVYLTFNICYYWCRDYLVVGHDDYFGILGTLLPIYFIVLLLFGTYRSIWKYAAVREYVVCNIACVTAGACYFFISRYLLSDRIPFYFYLLVTCASAMALIFFRLLYRAYRDVVTGKASKLSLKDRRRCVIVGAGAGGNALLSELRLSKDAAIHPVAFVDDDEIKVGKNVAGVPVAATTDHIGEVVKKYRADMIVIAIPSASNRRRGELVEKCSDCRVEVKMLPQLLDFEAEDRHFIQKIRDITPDELLGRDTVNVVNEDVLSFISGKTVLVTGGGGSIGSELCRQVAANSPKRLVIVDIYENNAYDIEQELRRHYGDALDLKVLIASVRDYPRIRHIIEITFPDLIIHAAAHKHVPLMEDSPAEAVKNNIFGTFNVAMAARECRVPRMIMISTDKAVNPTNIMGATKRVCEMIIQSMDAEAEYTSYSCVRFGNVLGSNGSVIPLFKKQIAEGGPVTVTHPDIIRYFMTIPEAVQLVLVTGAIAKGGEIFVLDMGKPVRILDLAEKMIAIAGKKVDIEFIGLRPGEKLYEELLMSEEGLATTEKDRIHVGHPITFDPEHLKRCLDELWHLVNDETLSDSVMMALIEDKLHEITPTFNRA